MTIKDLAAMTGYSVGTVSRVLNNQPHVSDMARKVILRAAEECGFQLNTNAKELKQQHGNSILVICKGTGNELFDGLLVSIQARIARTQYPLIVDYIDEAENEVRRAVQLCREKKPLGVLFLGGQPGEFSGRFLPHSSSMRAGHQRRYGSSFPQSFQRVLRRRTGCPDGH